MGKLTLGEYTYGSLIRRGEGNTVTVGKFCSLAEGIIVDGGFNHNTKLVSTFPFNQKFPEYSHLDVHPVIKGDVVIGNDVWIGEGCMIMSGVTIGDGACIGARTIVTKDVPAYSVVVGSPQRIVRYRFSPGQISALQNIAWWNWPIEKIRESIPLLLSEDIQHFINKHK